MSLMTLMGAGPGGAGGSGPPFTPPAAPPVTTGLYGLYMSREVNNGGNPPAGNISAWFDRSGNGNSLSISDPGEAVYSLSGGPNSLPAVIIGEGADDGLATTNAFDGSTGFTIVWVGKFTDITSGQPETVFCIGDGSGATSGNGMAFICDGGSGVGLLDNLGNEYPGSSVFIDQLNHIWVLSVDTTTARLWKDGALLFSCFITLNLTSAGFTIGSGNSFADGSAPMNLMEASLYKGPFTIAQVNATGAWYSGTGSGAPVTGLTWTPYVFGPDYIPGLLGWWEPRFVSPQTAGPITSLPGQAGSPNATGTGTLMLNDINGQPSMLLNGTSNMMYHGVGPAGAFTLVLLAKRTADSVSYQMGLNACAPSTVLYGEICLQFVGFGANWQGLAAAFLDSGQSCLNQYRLMMLRADGAGNATLNTDAGANVTGALTPFAGDPSDRRRMGSDTGTVAFQTGNTAMALIYKGFLSDANLALVKQYSTSIYAIP